MCYGYKLWVLTVQTLTGGWASLLPDLRAAPSLKDRINSLTVMARGLRLLQGRSQLLRVAEPGHHCPVPFQVLYSLLNQTENMDGWPHVVSEDIVKQVHRLKNEMFVMGGKIKGKTLLPIPEHLGSLDGTLESMERLVAAREGRIGARAGSYRLATEGFRALTAIRCSSVGWHVRWRQIHSQAQHSRVETGAPWSPSSNHPAVSHTQEGAHRIHSSSLTPAQLQGAIPHAGFKDAERQWREMAGMVDRKA